MASSSFGQTRITPLQAVLRYHDLLHVESVLRRAKATIRTRPIYHSFNEAIRGHVFCSFLALVLGKEREDCCQRIGLRRHWCDVPRELDRMQRATIQHNGKDRIMRTGGDGLAAVLLKAVGIAPLPRIQATPPPNKDRVDDKIADHNCV